MKARVVEPDNLRMVHAHTLEPAVVVDLTGVSRTFGAKMGYYHRTDLHSGLKELALQDVPGGEDDAHPWGPPVVIKLGNGVVDLDCEAGVLVLADGTTVAKDLIVVADGIKSRFVSKITGREEAPKHMGWSAYRCLIPMSSILSDPACRPIFENQPPGCWTPFYLPKAFYMVAYPCRNGETLNIALRHTTQPKDRDKDDWNSSATHEDVLELLDGYHPIMGEIIKMAPEVKIYKLMRREPLPRYWRGRAVVIGDAAHTLPPTHAQGAVLAVEEAAALELLFKGVTDPALAEGRLELFSKLLKKHIHVAQYLSDTVPGTRDEFRRRAEELCGDELYSHEAMGFTPPVQKFFYTYDVRKEVTKGMKEAGIL